MKTTLIKVLLLVMAFFCLTNVHAQDTPSVNIIPQPLNMETKGGEFLLPEKVVIGYDASLKPQAEYLQELLARSTGRVAELKEGKSKGSIVLQKDTIAVPVAEAYTLSVTPKCARIVASDASGAFYGIQTLLQLFPAEVYSASWQRNTEWKAPCVEIYDAP